ncbi:hypothetical protein PHYBLDRAFT_149449 [Phycomyces blakesleeanus NRRL 1555(-)]|uniref:Uncharacterized protein n=1 Tax=Phycomyces blakesleeanus (strain ATCC 8743b / DSM 1359 / FGSC 10004 / NBRC 33097 / NRRL 1555) TaxID=763407 RepID=A0A162PKB4_PHYB8|nr:hypothetical protein PHYBLDRAFT_149449 [Phycomyces blakesleeanus NRRL 1555(-)]OAD69666.1 hypothetical protein PHYBLDRAFT_149449 [Phycomyces blakesleeanus NRRL 1555(-)]|eukprot:XP_018287706.1 hypothetical protein PHYBLDRAFT_149449 [Phycomyces blakesleeanus NRRL 1555(-)]
MRIMYFSFFRLLIFLESDSTNWDQIELFHTSKKVTIYGPVESKRRPSQGNVAKAKNPEIKIAQLANKRKKLHWHLHLRADNEAVNSLLVGQPPTAATLQNDKIDNFFNSGPSFSVLPIKSDLNTLLCYNILDFVTTRQKAGTKSILGN